MFTYLILMLFIYMCIVHMRRFPEPPQFFAAGWQNWDLRSFKEGPRHTLFKHFYQAQPKPSPAGAEIALISSNTATPPGNVVKWRGSVIFGDLDGNWCSRGSLQVHDLFMTFLQLVHFSFTTCSSLVLDFLITCLWLGYDLSMSCSQLVYN